MADDTFRIMTPITVTGEALPVIGSLQVRPGQVTGLAFGVTLSTGKNSSLGAVMVAGGAAGTHFGHAGMQLMAKIYRFTQINKNIKHHRTRRLAQVVLRGLIDHSITRARNQTVMKSGWYGAAMATRAIERLCLLNRWLCVTSNREDECSKQDQHSPKTAMQYVDVDHNATLALSTVCGRPTVACKCS